jgi:hypothetical protein
MVSQLGLLDWEAPAARRFDPETSHLAASRAKLGASIGRLTVLRHLSNGPLTDYELAVASGMQQNSIGKRRSELCDYGLAEVACDSEGDTIKRPSPTGCLMRVWRITEAGREFYTNARPGA